MSNAANHLIDSTWGSSVALIGCQVVPIVWAIDPALAVLATIAFAAAAAQIAINGPWSRL